MIPDGQASTALMPPSGLDCVGGSDLPTLGQADPLATRVLVELLQSEVPGVSCFAEFGGVQVPPVKKRRKQVPVPPEKRDDACRDISTHRSPKAQHL